MIVNNCTFFISFPTDYTDYKPLFMLVLVTNDLKTHCVTIEVNDDATDEDTEELFIRASGQDISLEATSSIHITDDGKSNSALPVRLWLEL